jgi:PKD domain
VSIEDLARLSLFPHGKGLLPTIRFPFRCRKWLLPRVRFPFPRGKGLGVRFVRIVRDARTVATLAVTLLLLISTTTSAVAQNATPTPTPMVMPMIPQIQLQTVPAYGPAPLTVGYFVSSLNPDAAPLTSYVWSFGDGQVSMLPPTALFHTYTNPGSYIVNVTATDTDGHQASAFAGVTVTQPAQ